MGGEPTRLTCKEVSPDCTWVSLHTFNLLALDRPADGPTLILPPKITGSGWIFEGEECAIIYPRNDAVVDSFFAMHIWIYVTET